MYRASFASKTTKRQHTVFEHCLEGRILKENSSLCINANMFKSSSLNACKFTSELNLLFTTSVQQTTFRLNNWNRVASFDAIQIAKTTFLPSKNIFFFLVLNLLESSKWAIIQNGGILSWTLRGLPRVTMATRKIHGNSRNSTHSAGGAKIALDPGLNSLENAESECKNWSTNKACLSVQKGQSSPRPERSRWLSTISAVVYKFPCDLCNTDYVRYTARHLHQCIGEHKHSRIVRHLEDHGLWRSDL